MEITNVQAKTTNGFSGNALGFLALAGCQERRELTHIKTSGGKATISLPLAVRLGFRVAGLRAGDGGGGRRPPARDG